MTFDVITPGRRSAHGGGAAFGGNGVGGGLAGAAHGPTKYAAQVAGHTVYNGAVGASSGAQRCPSLVRMS